MKSLFLFIVMMAGASFMVQAQNTSQKKTVVKSIQEDSTTLFKIIPGEIPRPIVDSLQRKNYQLGDVFTAHRNGTSTMYVVEIAHELVRETFWFDPRGHQIRPSAKKIN